MITVKENVPLAPATTFSIGGAAKYFVEVRNDAEIQEAIQWAREHSVPHIMFGGGSNVLVPDEGIDALVIKVVSDLWRMEEDTLIADAGCNLLSLIRGAGEQGFGGWEKLAGIPGTIGGAVRGNAGAFGPEIKDFLTEVEAIHSADGTVKTFQNNECEFGYRQSHFKQHPEWVILRAHIKLTPIGATENERLIEETIAEREKRHLQNVRAAGSYFTNPVAPAKVVEIFEKEKGVKSRGGRVPAGWLIEKAGMKGAKVGDAIASLQHPNYIVNQGNATAVQVRELAEKIKDAVEEQFGVQLEEEAAIL